MNLDKYLNPPRAIVSVQMARYLFIHAWFIKLFIKLSFVRHDAGEREKEYYEEYVRKYM